MKKAIAYVSDIIVGRGGEIISRDQQREAIRAHAQEHDLEIVGWFEDEVYEEDPLARPGLQALLACDKTCDVVLLERVWAISRRWGVLKPIVWQIRERGKLLECTTFLWDATSQRSRALCRLPWPTKPAVAERVDVARAVRVAKEQVRAEGPEQLKTAAALRASRPAKAAKLAKALKRRKTRIKKPQTSYFTELYHRHE